MARNVQDIPQSQFSHRARTQHIAWAQETLRGEIILSYEKYAREIKYRAPCFLCFPLLSLFLSCPTGEIVALFLTSHSFSPGSFLFLLVFVLYWFSQWCGLGDKPYPFYSEKYFNVILLPDLIIWLDVKFWVKSFFPSALCTSYSIIFWRLMVLRFFSTVNLVIVHS